jgi:methylmalonyl-CoA mutase N-terminal domain/subunit
MAAIAVVMATIPSSVFLERSADDTGSILSSVADVGRLAHGVKLGMAGFHFDAGAAFLPAASLYIAFAKQSGVPLNELRGGFNADPLKALARDGNLPVPLYRPSSA